METTTDGQREDEITWGEAVADCIRQLYGTKEEKTRRFYAGRLRVLTQWAEGKDIALPAFRVRHLREFLACRLVGPDNPDGVTERTVRHDAIAARVFLRFCAQEGYIPSNPLVGYEIPKAAKAYVKCPSDDEVIRLLAAARDRWKVTGLGDASRFVPQRLRTFLGRRNYAIITGLIETACRAGEVLGLRMADYDPAQKQVVIHKAKGNKPRIIPISDEWAEVVDAWLRVRPQCDNPLLFITEYGDPIKVEVFGKQFHGLLEHAGLSGFTLHGLRHYALNQIARTDLQAAMHIAGHTSLTVTQGYLHAGADHIRQAHATAAPLARLLVSRRAEKAKKKRLV